MKVLKEIQHNKTISDENQTEFDITTLPPSLADTLLPFQLQGVL
jgi:hypothetical protein